VVLSPTAPEATALKNPDPAHVAQTEDLIEDLIEAPTVVSNDQQKAVDPALRRAVNPIPCAPAWT